MKQIRDERIEIRLAIPKEALDKRAAYVTRRIGR